MQGHVNKDLTLQHIDVNTVTKIPVDKMPNLKTVYLVGNFGDPLMHPKIENILDHFVNQKVVISTNASLRDETWWERLASRENVEVIFAIDGLEDTNHLYRRETDFGKIMRNAKRFIASGGTAIWQYIVFKHNEHQVAEAKKLSQEIGFKEIDFLYTDRFELSNRFKVYDKGKYLYDLEKATAQKTLRDKLGSPNGEKQWKTLYKNYKGGSIECVWSRNKKIYIHSDSTVFACCHIGNIQSGRHIEKMLYNKIIKDIDSVNLRKNSFADVLNSDAFQKHLPASLKGKPFSHPVCIEYCNKDTGRIVNEGLTVVNT